MATYVLIHGAGSDSWYWHLVAPQLRALGHDVVAPDLPCDDDRAGLQEYTDVVVDAIGDRTDLILVAQSMAGFTAPLVCARVPVDLVVLVNAMIPVPGETPGDWWANTGQPQARRELDERDGRPTERPFDPVPAALGVVPAAPAVGPLRVRRLGVRGLRIRGLGVGPGVLHPALPLSYAHFPSASAGRAGRGTFLALGSDCSQGRRATQGKYFA